MVAAGIKRVINQGREGLSMANSTVNSGLREVSPIRTAVLKKAQESMATNTTIHSTKNGKAGTKKPINTGL